MLVIKCPYSHLMTTSNVGDKVSLFASDDSSHNVRAEVPLFASSDTSHNVGAKMSLLASYEARMLELKQRVCRVKIAMS